MQDEVLCLSPMLCSKTWLVGVGVKFIFSFW